MSFRNRHIWSTAALVLALMPFGALEGQGLGKRGADALAAALRDPLSFFSDRSPGSRGGGSFYSSKPGLFPADSRGPARRVLPGARQRPQAMTAVDPAQLLNSIPNVLPPAGTPALGVPGDLGPSGALGDRGAVIPIPIPGLPGGGTGGGGVLTSPPAITPGTPPAVAPSAVPEPSSWILMILGVGLLGLQLRRIRHRLQQRTA